MGLFSLPSCTLRVNIFPSFRARGVLLYRSFLHQIVHRKRFQFDFVLFNSIPCVVLFAPPFEQFINLLQIQLLRMEYFPIAMSILLLTISLSMKNVVCDHYVICMILDTADSKDSGRVTVYCLLEY